MRPGGDQIHRQQGKMLQDSFNKRATFGPDLRAHRTMHPVEQFTRGDHGEKKLFFQPLCYVLFQVKPPPLSLNQDAGID
jgi:hypothetical protein